MQNRPTAIDMCDVVFDRAGWRAYLRALLGSAPLYLSSFAARFGKLTGRAPADIRASFAASPFSTIDWLADRLAAADDIGHHVDRLVADGISLQVVHGGSWPCDQGNVNDLVAASAADYPNTLIGWGGVTLGDPGAALRETVRVLDHLRMAGLSIIPFLDGVDICDPAYDGVWSAAAERDVPVWIHCGQNFRSDIGMDISGPSVIDRLAGRYPELRIVIGHGGWPWILDTIAVVQRHENVHLEFSSHDPVTMATPGSGWEPLFMHGARSVKRKVMFGSTSWTHGVPAGEVARRAEALPIDEATRDAWMFENAARFLRVDRKDIS